jgi:PKD repeat protein
MRAMKKTGILMVGIWLVCVACEPFNLAKQDFPVCVKPSAEIGTIVTKLEVEFYLNNPQGEIGATGWDLGDRTNRTSNRFTYRYAAPGTYTVTLVLGNKCSDSFTTSRTVTVTN